MHLAEIIHTYGYLALFLGTFVEGEVILVMGGFAASRGHLALPGVILAAFLGSVAGDQLFFFLGRWKGRAYVLARPRWRIRLEKVHRLIEKYQVLVLLTFRFAAGLRTITPFTIGLTRVPVTRFILLNSASALVWAVLVTTGGYLFGATLEALVGDLRRFELEALVGIALLGAVIWVARAVRKKREPEPEGPGSLKAREKDRQPERPT